MRKVLTNLTLCIALLWVGNHTDFKAVYAQGVTYTTSLSNTVWTNARAGYLDNLSAGAVALNSDIATLLTRLSAGRATNLDNLDATVSSRAPSSTALSTATYTSGRASNLDNLDATVSSRAASSTALSTGTWTSGRASNLDNLDATVSTGGNVPATDSTSNTTGNQVVGSKADTKAGTGTAANSTLSLAAYIKGMWDLLRSTTFSNLDTTISSRLATSGYTAPDNTRPTNFTSFSIDGSGRVDVTKVAGTAQTARDLGAQLDAAISSRSTQANVWTNGTRNLTSTGYGTITQQVETNLAASGTLDLRPASGTIRQITLFVQAGAAGSSLIQLYDGTTGRTITTVSTGAGGSYTGISGSTTGIRIVNNDGSNVCKVMYIALDTIV